MRANQPNMWRSMLRPALFAALVMVFLLYIPTPYVVYEPGIVEKAGPMVNVAYADPQGRGSFMLTTVQLSNANFWTVARTWWADDMLLVRKSELLGGRSPTEYAERLVTIMHNSQSNAIEAAYRQTGIEYRIEPLELIVTDVAELGEAGFRPGDVLIELDGMPIRSADELAQQMTALRAGQALHWRIRRGSTEQELTTSVSADLSAAQAIDLPRLFGVQLAQVRDLVPSHKGWKVSIESGSIGGPSAGLIFALQILDELTAGDLTGGRRIAGTGTIGPDGVVGPIGGVGLKVVAAARSGAALFLAPGPNYEEAARKAEAIGTDMQIVAADTLGEAIAALGEDARRQVGRR
ncbi:peptidase S16 [Paenibacillus sp. IB182496]|uniref:Peptidase S16 n=1 Tax=Paenibacillus sabuli TaxID=2772509 RepID=A0A927BVA3_9BACL|nr:PDZ domain-containing protein [Paenibacillus sabuli]MBD2846129.1 peptidase S16 [Paenibacillus sabuli]